MSRIFVVESTLKCAINSALAKFVDRRFLREVGLIKPITTAFTFDTDFTASKISFKSVSMFSTASWKTEEVGLAKSTEYGIFDWMEPETETINSSIDSLMRLSVKTSGGFVGDPVGTSFDASISIAGVSAESSFGSFVEGSVCRSVIFSVEASVGSRGILVEGSVKSAVGSVCVSVIVSVKVLVDLDCFSVVTSVEGSVIVSGVSVCISIIASIEFDVATSNGLSVLGLKGVVSLRAEVESVD